MHEIFFAALEAPRDAPLPPTLGGNPNTWLRMKREGDTFIAYSGATGSAWTEFARNQIDTVGVAVIEAWIQSLTPVDPPTVALVDPLDGANFPTPVLTAIVLESIGSSGLYGNRNQDAICRPTQSISALTVPT